MLRANINLARNSANHVNKRSGSLMKKYTKLALVSVLTGTIAACSSSDSNPVEDVLPAGNTTAGPAADPTTAGDTSTAGAAADAGATSSGDTTAGNGATDGDGSTAGELTTGGDTGNNDIESTAGIITTGGDNNADGGNATAGDTTAGDTTAGDTTTGDTTGGDTTAGDTSDDGGTTGVVGDFTPSGTSPLGNPPTLADPFAPAIPSPDSNDPFGFDLEIDGEAAVAGGPPTTPKNLRIDLISNDWAEINWAPSNDDVAVEEYRIYRSDGHIYTIREDQTDPASGTVDEIAKIWRTTSFIDCNYTRFLDRLHVCAENGPEPGETYSYQVTAVDGDGQESPRSNSITVTYHLESNAPVPKTDDFYKDPGDTFVQDHDLSDTSFFLDKFSMVFEDNFDGPEVDANKWQTGLTWGDTQIINGEQQYFVNTQQDALIDYNPFKFEDGDLIIEAIKTPDDVVDLLPPVCAEEDPSGLERCQFLSGALSSHDRFGMTYGYVEGRMKVGGTSGMLSSFYMYHRYPGLEKQLHGPEIDIVEYLGENPFGDEDAFQTYHFRDVTDGTIRSAPTMNYKNPTGELYSDDYHTFGVLWEPQLVVWYIDGKEIKRLSGPQVARQQLNIVTYLVAGSAWAPTPADDDSIYPLQYKIDYIRAYQRPEYSSNGLYPE